MSKGSNTLNQQTAKPSRSVLFGAAFLMATSAIGPGFLTQTSKFTAQFGTALSLVIVLAIIMDITAQMNIWSVVSVSGMRAQDVANKLLPGLGVVIAILVAIGGLAFNVGNKDLLLALTTLLGGSCGGYIAFSGAHRLLDAGISGPENISHVRRSVLQGCGTSGLVRILLFLAVLGTCAMASGNAATIIAAGNPAAEAFRLAAGNIGYRLFGLCLFSAGVSSVVGAAYTSVSFLKTLHPFIAKYERQFVIGFITFSTVMMVVLGNAAALLIIAGAFNGLILPVTLGVMLIAGHNKRIVGESYHHPLWMTVLGAVVTLVALYAGIKAVPGIMQLFQ